MKPNPTLFSVAASLFVAASSHAFVFVVDFGDAAFTTAGNYNNMTAAQSPISNVIDVGGASTGVAITSVGFNPGSNQNGTTAPSGSAAIFDPQATRDNLFGHTVNFNQPAPLPVGTITLSGLPTNAIYTFDFFASRTGVADDRSTRYLVTGADSDVIELNASNNVSNIATVSDITPTSGGSITITVTPGSTNNNSSGFFYIGAMRVTSVTVPEPGVLGLSLCAGLAALRRRRA